MPLPIFIVVPSFLDSPHRTCSPWISSPGGPLVPAVSLMHGTEKALDVWDRCRHNSLRLVLLELFEEPLERQAGHAAQQDSLLKGKRSLQTGRLGVLDFPGALGPSPAPLEY